MIKSSIKTQQRATNGFKVLMESNAVTQVQATWRFLNNPNVTTDDLFIPIVTHLEEEIKEQCKKYVLMPSDW